MNVEISVQSSQSLLNCMNYNDSPENLALLVASPRTVFRPLHNPPTDDISIPVKHLCNRLFPRQCTLQSLRFRFLGGQFGLSSKLPLCEGPGSGDQERGIVHASGTLMQSEGVCRQLYPGGLLACGFRCGTVPRQPAEGMYVRLAAPRYKRG